MLSLDVADATYLFHYASSDVSLLLLSLLLHDGHCARGFFFAIFSHIFTPCCHAALHIYHINIAILMPLLLSLLIITITSVSAYILAIRDWLHYNKITHWSHLLPLSHYDWYAPTCFIIDRRFSVYAYAIDGHWLIIFFYLRHFWCLMPPLILIFISFIYLFLMLPLLALHIIEI